MKSEIIDIPTSKLARPIAGRDHIQGSIDAPISLLEYGDYECPYCGEAHPIVKAIQKRLGDDLCFAFRNFPLIDAHPHAQRAAEAVEAAAAQGAFWEMHNMVFENQEALEDEDLAGYATLIGLDSQRLMADLVTGAQTPRVQVDLKSGVRAGVQGTPAFFINGVFFNGDYESDLFFDELTAAASRKERKVKTD